MFSVFKGITVVVCTFALNSALADQRAQSAMNQNGSDAVISRMRHSWKNVGVKPVAAPTRKPVGARSKGKVRSLFTQAKPAFGR